MTDREQAITTLIEHLDHWKRLLSEGICTKDEGERTINALAFAIESIKALDEIIAKIEEQKELRCFDDDDMFVYRTGLDDALYIIDKYRKEQK